MPAYLRIPDTLLIPFGVPKWEIDQLKVVGVDSESTYIESDVPCAFIDLSTSTPLTLSDARLVLPDHELAPEDYYEIGQGNPGPALESIHQALLRNCALQTDAEREFLRLCYVKAFK